MNLARILLGLVLLTAGVGHLTVARQTFQAQVHPWLPFDPEPVVVVSRVVEIVLGLALALLTVAGGARSRGGGGRAAWRAVGGRTSLHGEP